MTNFAGSPERNAAQLRRLRRLGLRPTPRDLISCLNSFQATVESLPGGSPLDGMAARDNEGELIESWQVKIARGMPATRMRFTLAHELGHVLLRHKGVEPFQDEERWCDQFAAEILMPRAWLLANFQNFRPSFASIDGLSNAAGVSRSAALIRFNEVAGWSLGLIVLRKDHAVWAVDSMIGVGRATFLSLTPSRQTFGTIERAAGPQRPATLLFEHESGVLAVGGDLSRQGRTASFLVNSADLEEACIKLRSSAGNSCPGDAISRVAWRRGVGNLVGARSIFT